jgi:hypothetical protein
MLIYIIMRKRVGRPRMAGRGLGSLVKKANDFLKKTKVISKVANSLASIPQLSAYAGPIGNAASSLGYGRKRRVRRMIRH